MTARVCRIVGVMRPGIGSVRCSVPRQVKYFHDPIPDSLPLKNLFHSHAFNVKSVRSVQSADYLPQFSDVTHSVASTRSRTVQKSFSTPAAIAGVHRKAL